LAWQIGCVNQVIIGKDPFIGDNSSYKLSTSLTQHLNNRCIYTIAQMTLPNTLRSSQSWIDANQLGLSGEFTVEWNSYITNLKRNGVTLNNTNEKIVWSWNKAIGTITYDLAYQCIDRILAMEFLDCGISLYGELIYQVKLFVSCGCA